MGPVAQISTARTWRGGEQQAFWLGEGLRDEGVASVFVAPPASPLAEKVRAAGFDFVPLPARRAWNPLRVWALAREFARRGVRLVHAHDAHAVGWARRAVPRGAAALCTRRVDIPIRRGRKYAGLARVIAISEAVRAACLRAGVPEGKLRLVMSGVDLDRARGVVDGRSVLPPREALRGTIAEAHCPGKKRRLFLLCVGGLVATKGQDDLIKAMPTVLAAHPNAQLLLAGEGPYEEALRSLAKTRGVEADVSFLGFREDVPALLSIADVYVMPSRQEGLGTSLMDAMAAGCAVVGARSGGIPELVEDGKTGRLVPPGDPPALAAALMELCASQRLREHYGRMAAAAADRRFGKRAMVAGTLAVYRELPS